MVKYICQSPGCLESEARKFGRFEGDSDAEFCPRCGGQEIKKASKDIFNFGHSYSCLDCGGRSDYEEPPENMGCLYCESPAVVWIPPKYKSASDVDKTLRRIADRYGLSDMGQRGGTRAGESARQARPEAKVERVVNLQGFEVPVTRDGSISTRWSGSAPVNTRLKPEGVGLPYGGLAKAKALPTRLAAKPFNG